jgi:hypothetical protein
MKIGFTGASGQGKTTTAERLLLYPEFIHFKYIKSTSRIAAQHGYAINESATPLSQLLITNSRIAAESQYTGHSYVSERTPLDSLAYTNVVSLKNGGWDDYYMAISEQIVQSYMSRYDFVFYFPLRLEVQGDIYRSSDPQFHIDVDLTIKLLLQLWDVKHYTLTKIDPQERVDEIRNYLYDERYK